MNGALTLCPHLPETRDAFINSIALLKRNALAAPFEQAFREQKQLESSGSNQGQLMQMHYRDEEAIYVRASADRVTVIFSTVFREETDRIFGKLFLQARSRFHQYFSSQTSDCARQAETEISLSRNSLMLVACRPSRMPLKSSTRTAILRWSCEAFRGSSLRKTSAT